jgi:tetratricopeptide (TPR) repeat protein
MIKRDDTKKAVKADKAEKPDNAGGMKPGEYLRPVIAHLRKGEQKEAYGLLQQAIVEFPDDPFILSYYGCLQALVDKKYRAGVDKCKQAISMGLQVSTYGEDVLFPVFYLNLGRAYIAARRKHDALDAFKKGLEYDKSNREILMEMRALGSRKKTAVPFLDRSNPINKYIGKMVHKENKATNKKG